MTVTDHAFVTSEEFLEMPEAEQLKLARRWWERTGRHAIPHAFNQVMRGGSSRSGGRASFVVRPSAEPDLASGILRGLDWDELTNRERVSVLTCFAEALRATEHQREVERREALACDLATRLGVKTTTEKREH